MMRSLTDSGVLWVLLFAAIVVIYFLPTLIGMARGVDRLALVFLVNLIGTFIGWPAALILAFGPRRLPQEPAWPRHPGTIPGQPRAWAPGPWDER